MVLLDVNNASVPGSPPTHKHGELFPRNTTDYASANRWFQFLQARFPTHTRRRRGIRCPHLECPQVWATCTHPHALVGASVSNTTWACSSAGGRATGPNSRGSSWVLGGVGPPRQGGIESRCRAGSEAQTCRFESSTMHRESRCVFVGKTFCSWLAATTTVPFTLSVIMPLQLKNHCKDNLWRVCRNHSQIYNFFNGRKFGSSCSRSRSGPEH